MITVLFGGSRPNGNTAQLTKFALQDLEYQWIDVTQHQFKPIRDVRHTAETITSYDDDYLPILDKILASDTIIFASPVYWYSISAPLKAFIDIGQKHYKINDILILRHKWPKRILELF